MVRRHPLTLAIISALKPVDDVRMYRKFARSLARTGEFGVNIVGFRSKDNPQDNSVVFHPIFCFPRLSARRLGANYHCYRALLRIAPSVIVLTTPELFPAVAWYRRKHTVTIVYDMVENYRRNVRYNRGFARPLVRLLAALVARAEERLLRLSDSVILAERGYRQELTLPAGTPTITIENKALRPAVAPSYASAERPFTFVYTGTVSEVYGIKLALNVVRQLIESTQWSARLVVMGHVPLVSLHNWLQNYAQRHAWLDLRISPRPVPHEDILSLIRRADIGIVSHQPVPSIEHCFPTRIWEYMAHRLPFLLQHHPYWTDYCAPWQCAVPLDFNQFDGVKVRQQLLRTDFYPKGVPEDIWWESEEQKLISSIRNATLRLSPPH